MASAPNLHHFGPCFGIHWARPTATKRARERSGIGTPQPLLTKVGSARATGFNSTTHSEHVRLYLGGMNPLLPRYLNFHLRTILRVLLLSMLGLLSFSPDALAAGETSEFRAMAWNIWHGGREDGKVLGPQRVVEVIRESGADLVAMQETYGSGELIAKALGYHFQPRGTNVSIHSRYPILEDISVFEEFKCVGALVELPGGQRIAFYSIWLPYDGEIWEEGTRDPSKPDSMLAACKSSARDLTLIHKAIAAKLAGDKYAGIPILIAGDFNSMSHLDYSEVAVDQHQVAIQWETSRILTEEGFRDSFRECNPHIGRVADRTWTPRFPKQEPDRIDFVYYKSSPTQRLRALDSKMIDQLADGFPSDHAATVTHFELGPRPAPAAFEGRAVSYNIKHGHGNDDVVDLVRSADVLQRYAADFIGLQEVDENTARCGAVNQASWLGERLGYHAAFGPFMDYDGGRYGLAILTRHPIVRTQVLRLKTGNEPRVALLVDVRLPDDRVLSVINLHFDWVNDDGFRFAQAQEVARFLKTLDTPYILLGDFNDGPDSRTLALFKALAAEAKKPVADRYSFSSIQPEKEIDFLFAAPAARWKFPRVFLGDEPVVSDHRPLIVDLHLDLD